VYSLLRRAEKGSERQLIAERKRNMKKLFAVIALLCMATVFATAEAPVGNTSRPHADVGDLMVNVGANMGWGSFGLGGGVEYIFAKWDIPNFAPLTFGTAAKAGLFFGNSLHTDIAALGTMHFGLKTFSSLPAFLRNFDWYYGLGVGFGIGDTGGFGLSTGTGISYYLNPKLALNADYFYTNYFGAGAGSSGTLGIKMEL
jgi:opacity protein-like surface antigen